MASRSVQAHDTTVRLRRPVVAATLCLLTGGIWGAVHHHRLTGDIARFGRARGQMPFAFTPVSPRSATAAWIGAVLAWYLVVGLLVDLGIEFANGAQLHTEDITAFTSVALLLSPLWLVAAASLRRIRTVQHLAGVPRPIVSTSRGALASAVFPPAASFVAQHQLNRAWRQYG